MRQVPACRLFSEPEAISSEIFNSPLSVDASSLLGAEDHIDVSLADGIDYDTIVREELLQRKGNDLPDACTYAFSSCDSDNLFTAPVQHQETRSTLLALELPILAY